MVLYLPALISCSGNFHGNPVLLKARPHAGLLPPERRKGAQLTATRRKSPQLYATTTQDLGGDGLKLGSD
jgi:hypothetical protein